MESLINKMNEEEEKAHRELDKRIRGCRKCRPITPFEGYCNDCLQTIINFANKYGAGVLTRDEGA